MEKTIKVGEREMKFKSSAATNILYKRAFKEDLIVILSAYAKNLKELKRMQSAIEDLKNSTGRTDEEVMGELNSILTSDAYTSTQTFSSETLPRLAFIMFLEANEKIGTIFSKLNEESYLGWLLGIDQDELLEVTGEVMDIWQAGTKTHSIPKN